MRRLTGISGGAESGHGALVGQVDSSGSRECAVQRLEKVTAGGMKRVCIFCEEWASGGIESFIKNTVLCMDLRTIQIDILAARRTDSAFTEHLEACGVRFLELSGDKKSLLKNYRLFVRLLTEREYDAVHLHIFHGLSMVYACLAKRAGVPVRIAHSHNNALRKSRMRRLKMLIHHTAKNLYTSHATDLWACSAQAAEFLFSKRQLAAKGFQFVPNGIDIERFRFDRAVREKVRKQSGLCGKLVIGNVGRLCYQKNQDFLLDIFAEMLRRKPDSCLLLVGEGEAEAELHQKAKLLGISHAVIFCGTSPHVEQLLWAMDVFLFPSIFEGLGIAVVEAQAAGLPAVCSESIPAEARILDRVRALPLAASADAWAETALALAGLPRTGTEADQVRAAGFDAAGVAARIEARYRED